MRFLLLVLSAALAAGCSSAPRSAQGYPASARVSGSGDTARYQICHKGKNTLTLPRAAVDAHLRHGDRFGTCRGDRRQDDRRDDRRDRRGRNR